MTLTRTTLPALMRSIRLPRPLEGLYVPFILIGGCFSSKVRSRWDPPFDNG